MNGVNLLLLLAAVGQTNAELSIKKDTFEVGADGYQYYTIQIESGIEALNRGFAIDVPVGREFRDLRRFQIIVGRKTASRPLLREDKLLEIGWKPLLDPETERPAGGMEVLVQLLPERVASLAKGFPVVGEVDLKVTDVRKILIYTGTGPVPRVLTSELQAQAAKEFPASPRDPALATPRSTTPNFRGSESGAPDLSQGAPWGSTRQPVEQPVSAGQTGGEWRGSAAVDPRLATPRTGESLGDPRTWNSSNSAPYGADPRGGSQPVGQPGYGPPAYGQQNYSPAQNYGPAQNYPPMQNYGPGVDYAANQRGQFAARNIDQASPAAPPSAAAPPAPAAAAPAAAAASTPPAAPVTPQPVASWAAQYPSAGSGGAVEPKPWTPLILTSLALLASLGANGYLGWLAWGFFWRYRDAANDLARIRRSGSNRQAA